jgi:bifunctional non-homologous end joining protein LigD
VSLPRIQPINPTRIAAPFDHSNFVFELKHDGFRAVAYIEDGTCRLVSRKNVVYKSFARLTSFMAKLPVKNAILDGELVCLDDDGRSIFLDLRRRSRDACFYAFDLLWLDGQDLRGLTFLERKNRLRQLVRGRTGFLFAEHVPGRGIDLYQVICREDLEGIVAKHKLAPYVTSPPTWFKVLNPDYTQKHGRREMFEGLRKNRGSNSRQTPIFSAIRSCEAYCSIRTSNTKN